MNRDGDLIYHLGGLVSLLVVSIAIWLTGKVEIALGAIIAYHAYSILIIMYRTDKNAET